MNKYSNILFYSFIIISFLSFPSLFINWWFCYISAPLCISWFLFFFIFMLWKNISRICNKNNNPANQELNKDHVNFLGKIKVSHKIFVSDSLNTPMQFEFTTSPSKYYIYKYSIEKDDVSLLFLTPILQSQGDQNFLGMFQNATICENDLVVDSGSIIIHSENEGHKISNNTVFTIMPVYGDGAYCIAQKNINNDVVLIIELISGSIEFLMKYNCDCPTV